MNILNNKNKRISIFKTLALCLFAAVSLTAISPFIKDIRNNKLYVDWQITEQQNIIRK